MNTRIFRLVIIPIALLIGSLWPLMLQSEAAMLSYTFDDGSRYIYENAYPVMQKYKQPGVVYAIAERVENKYDNYINIEQFLEMQDGGWEIGSHSIRHSRLTQLPKYYEDEVLNQWKPVDNYLNVYECDYLYSDLALIYVDSVRFWGYKYSLEDLGQATQGYFWDSQNAKLYLKLPNSANPGYHEIRVGSAQREIQQSYSYLNAQGLRVSSFVPPYLDFNNSLLGFFVSNYTTIVTRLYENYNDNYNLLPLEGNYPLILTRMKSVKRETTVEEMTNAVDLALSKDAWVIISFHAIYEDDNFTDPYGWPKDKFEQLVSYINDSKIPVVTVSEGIALQCAPLPVEQHAWNYEPVEHPVKQCGPAYCKPFATGNLSGGNLDLQIGLPAFSEGVDVYLAIQSDVFGSDKIFMIDQNNNIQLLAGDLPSWKTNVSHDIDESLFGNIPVAALPSGSYNLYILVTPTGETDFSQYYFWSNSFLIQ